jgi:hypothetical protein
MHDRMDKLTAGQQNVTAEFKPLPKGW